jgi:hypothetical protein
MANGTFVENIAAGVEALGLKNAPIIFSLAKIRWETTDDRDAVLSFLGGDPDA